MISRIGGANSRRRQCDFTNGWCKWSGRRESKLFCPCIVWYSFGEWKLGVHIFFSHHSVYENGKRVK